ncbi:hypothetical protein SCHPADRAFT_591765 [Schizopora paradoxa]|uniref:Uncharacterized protein n=1 Tax=Schizopora paradoxa TaxID=27342 RepID=A0A0H2RAR6_9AGAM|nr:hypothetical protein SCHPADRAFT_591765 [Schizopora paradoxa]
MFNVFFLSPFTRTSNRPSRPSTYNATVYYISSRSNDTCIASTRFVNDPHVQSTAFSPICSIHFILTIDFVHLFMFMFTNSPLHSFTHQDRDFALSTCFHSSPPMYHTHVRILYASLSQSFSLLRMFIDCCLSFIQTYHTPFRLKSYHTRNLFSLQGI